MTEKLTAFQQEVMKRLVKEPIIARKTMQVEEGNYLGLRVWKFEGNPKQTIPHQTISSMTRKN